MSEERKGLKSYLDEIPLEVRRAIDGLSNDIRQAILTVLGERGKMRFSELQSELELSKPDLAFHLNRLMQTGLVSHHFDEYPSDESYAYYRLSSLGYSLLRSLEQAFMPMPILRQTGNRWVVPAGVSMDVNWSDSAEITTIHQRVTEISRLNDKFMIFHSKVQKQIAMVQYVGAHHEWRRD